MKRVAVLFDADNMPIDCVRPVLEHAERNFGGVVVKRAYGAPYNGGIAIWDGIAEKCGVVLARHAWKTDEATDCELCLDAAELLHSHAVDAICIASDDADFAVFGSHARKMGIPVYGYFSGNNGKAIRHAYDASFRFVKGKILKCETR